MKNIIEHMELNETGPLAQSFFTNDMLYIDIETTGLSPSSSFIYCIGTAYLSGGSICIHLIFGESRKDEAAVLEAFCALLKTRRHVVTFNGTTFDIPYIKKRCAGYSITDPFTGKKYTDLLREARSIKNILQLKSLSQKSLERFLGCSRDDEMSGGELIPVYYRYERTGRKSDLDLLILHNSDDVKGMIFLTEILSYRHFLNGRYKIISYDTGLSISGYMENPYAEAYEEAYSEGLKTIKGTPAFADTSDVEMLNIILMSSFPFPAPVKKTLGFALLSFEKDRVKITVPVCEGRLRHYFPDYRNYYYLPEEGTIIHRSLGKFVDKGHREPAKKENCYIEKTCRYIRLPSRSGPGYLRKDLKDKDRYVELRDGRIEEDTIKEVVGTVIGAV